MSQSQPQSQISLDQLELGVLLDGDLRLVLNFFGPHVKHQVPAYHFKMVQAESREEMGNINLRLGWNENLVMYSGHIGYGVNERFRGRGYATRSVKMLMPLARRHGFAELWITCNPDNPASRKSCEHAGARLVDIVAAPPESRWYALGVRQKCRYRLEL